HALVIDSMLQGASGLRGGGDALAKAMVTAIRANGGVVRTRTPVASLQMEGGLVCSATLANGEVVRGRTFISNAHPKQALALLPEGAMRPAYVHRVTRCEKEFPASAPISRQLEIPSLVTTTSIRTQAKTSTRSMRRASCGRDWTSRKTSS